MPVNSGASDINLNVLRFKQDKDMSCWFAAAQTVLSYRGIDLALGNTLSSISALIRVFEDKGIVGRLFTDFAREVGLNSNQTFFDKGFDRGAYYAYLAKLGPLWIPCIFQDKPGGRPHIVAVAGIIGDSLLIADPDGSKPFPLWMKVADLEAVRAKAFPILFKVLGPVI